MINKRLLIKNLLAHNDESSFYDKKRQLNLHTQEGKAKFLKHICALSNSNPSNNAYIVVGVEDEYASKTLKKLYLPLTKEPYNVPYLEMNRKYGVKI